MAEVPALPPDNGRRLATQLAAVFVRPLAHLSAETCASAFSGRDFAGLAAANPFYPPVNRAIAKGLGLADLRIDPDLLTRLETRPASRLCALLVSQPIAIVREAAKHVAAALLHKQVVGIVLKSDRAKLRTVLGEDAYRVATDESALLHQPLIAVNDLANDKTVLGDLSDEEATRNRVIGLGLRVLSRFVAICEPSLAAVFEMRLPKAEATGSAAVAALTRDHCDHITKLLRRRVPAWAASIA